MTKYKVGDEIDIRVKVAGVDPNDPILPVWAETTDGARAAVRQDRIVAHYPAGPRIEIGTRVKSLVGGSCPWTVVSGPILWREASGRDDEYWVVVGQGAPPRAMIREEIELRGFFND